MPNHDWARHCLALGQAQELFCKAENYIAIESHEVGGEGTIENGEQLQRVCERITKVLGPLNQDPSSLNSVDGLGGRITFGVMERLYQRQLKLDLLAPECRGRGQLCDLFERERKLINRLNKGRTVQGPLPRQAPKSCSFFNKTGLGAMTRDQLRSARHDIWKQVLENFDNTGM